MNKLDARRLTGINVIWHAPGAIVDVALDEQDDATQICAVWQSNVRSLLEAVGWSHHKTTHHRFVGGLALAISAPIDALYAAVEIAEWAWDVTEQTMAGTDTGKNLESSAEHFRQMIRDEQNPELIRLAEDAARHQV
ncbi:MAG: Mur ligase, partial [Gammaproteobacteria bacterium]|nr:Mur ligase [Gammaproteobacteria bacterium]